MSNYNARKRIHWRNITTRIVLITITVLLIVWFLPRNERQRFHYDIGKPWMYGSFIAKFDFPIYKSDEALKKERDSILKAFQSYYDYDENVEQIQLTKLRKDFVNGLPGLPMEYYSILAKRLHKLYQAGIMNTPEYNNIARDSANMVRVISGKDVKSTQVNSLYSTMTAYEQIFQDPRLNEQRQILQKCNLNDYIIPNLTYDKERSEAEKTDLLGSIPIASGMVISGQKIIDRGEIVDEYAYRVLSSFDKEMDRRDASSNEITNALLGQLLFVAILMSLFTIYLALFRKDYFDKPRSIMMLYTMITIFPIFTSLLMSHNLFSVYIIPFAMAPIFIRVFMDSRTAFIAHVTSR